MKIVVDEKRLTRNKKIARAIVLIVVAVALGAMIALLLGSSLPAVRNFNAAWLIPIELVVIAALILFSRVAFTFANRYLALNRPEQVLRDSLKGLDRKYSLMLFEKPTDYLLIEPGGLTVVIPRSQEGDVSYTGGKWRHKRGIARILTNRDEGIGDPTRDATRAMTDIKALLDAKDPDLRVPLRSVIVFTSPLARLTIDPAPIAAMRAADLKEYLRNSGKLGDLPKSVQRRMRAAIGAPDIEAAAA